MVLQQTTADADAGKSAEEKLADALNCVADDVDEEVEQVHDWVDEGGRGEVRCSARAVRRTCGANYRARPLTNLANERSP
jgi:hypothetical protein